MQGEQSSALVAERLPVWRVYSDLFLDTWFDRSQLDRMALVLVESPYDEAQLYAILRDEVGPAFIGNMFVIPGGEWAGWDDDEIIERIERSERSRFGKPFRRWLAMPTVKRGWKKLRQSMERVASRA